MDELKGTHISALQKLCPTGVMRNVDLSVISKWKIGGIASLVLQPSSTNELAMIKRYLHMEGLPYIVIGLTSNLLFADEGLYVPCIQIGSRMANISIQGIDVYAEAGIWLPCLARTLMQSGLTGGEHICGIPGTLGGLICMNGGSKRKGIGENVISVECMNEKGVVFSRTAEECEFGYRSSVFLKNSEIITGVQMRFSKGDRYSIHSEICDILSERRKKFPQKSPNCGSVFKSNPSMYSEIGSPGAVIESLGLKGMCQGNARVSEYHANFIINTGGARAKDVIMLINKISQTVYHKTGFKIDAEVQYVTADGRIMPADMI